MLHIKFVSFLFGVLVTLTVVGVAYGWNAGGFPLTLFPLGLLVFLVIAGSNARAMFEHYGEVS